MSKIICFHFYRQLHHLARDLGLSVTILINDNTIHQERFAVLERNDCERYRYKSWYKIVREKHHVTCQERQTRSTRQIVLAELCQPNSRIRIT